MPKVMTFITTAPGRTPRASNPPHRRTTADGRGHHVGVEEDARADDAADDDHRGVEEVEAPREGRPRRAGRRGKRVARPARQARRWALVVDGGDSTPAAAYTPRCASSASSARSCIRAKKSGL